MNKSYHAIVVGGGLGGLMCAARLAKHGLKVLLLEQHYIAGGCATTFKRKNFVVEVGLHELDGLDRHDLKVFAFREIGIFDKLQFLRLPEAYRYTSKNIDFVMPDNFEKAKAMLLEKFPTEKRAITKYFNLVKNVRLESGKMYTSKLPKLLKGFLYPVLCPNTVVLSSRRGYLAALTNPLFWLLRFKYIFFWQRNLGTYLDSITKNDKLKSVLCANLGYYHDDPYTMSLFYFAIAQSGYLMGGGYYIKGGSQKLSDALVEVITQNGGDVLLNSLVTKILVENNKAIGVEFTNPAYANKSYANPANATPANANESTSNLDDNRTRIYSDLVVYNGAVPNAVNLLPDTYGKPLQRKIQDMKYSLSLCCIYMGFSIDLKTINTHYSSTYNENNCDFKNFKENFYAPYEKRNFVFVDYSQIDSGLCPQGNSLGVLTFVDTADEWKHLSKDEYKAKKQRVMKIMHEKLEARIPGITKHLVFSEMSTPQTITHFTLNPDGIVYGFAQTPNQSSINRFKNKSSVDNLYYASAWTFPGGGFTGAIISGFLTANEVFKKRAEFSPRNTLVPLPTLDTRAVKLLAKNEIATNTLELILEKPKDFEYRAGQYAVLRVNTPSAALQKSVIDVYFRSLSMVSKPSDNTLAFAMRYSQSGFKQACAQAKVGDSFQIFGPYGEFELPKQITKPIVFLVAGIGITPVLSMLKFFAERNAAKSTAETESASSSAKTARVKTATTKSSTSPEMHLFYSNINSKTSAYLDTINKLKLDNLIVHNLYEDKGQMLDEALLKKTLGRLSNYSFYIDGPRVYTNAMLAILDKNKLTDYRIDDFG